MAKTIIDWGLCDGNGMCAVEAPTVFEMSDEDELIVLKEEVEGDEQQAVRSAARLCPKRAISLGA